MPAQFRKVFVPSGDNRDFAIWHAVLLLVKVPYHGLNCGECICGDSSKNKKRAMATDTIVSFCSDQYIEEQQWNPPEKKAEDTSQMTETGVSEEPQNEAETGSLVTEIAVLNGHVLLDYEDGVPPQIDCSVFCFDCSEHDRRQKFKPHRAKPHRLTSIV